MKTTDIRTLTPVLLLALALLAAGAAAADDLELGTISHWFQPAVFTHGDHADMLDCATCHHVGGEDDPGLCSDCHMADYDPADPTMPTLNHAYHLNCVGCHQEMGAPVACTDCHERGKLPAGPELGSFPVR